MPHSHHDPMWIKTFEGNDSYTTESRAVLRNVLRKLEEFPEGRLIFAEVAQQRSLLLKILFD